MTIRIREDRLAWCDVEEEVVIMHLDESEYFELNATGAHLWHRLVEGATAEELVISLRKRFDGDEPTAAADVDALVAELRELEMLSE